MVKYCSLYSTAWGRRQVSTTIPLPERQQARGQGSDPSERHGKHRAKAESFSDLPARQARAQGGPCNPGQLLRFSRELTTKNRGEHLLLPPLLWTSFSRRACRRERASPVVASGETGPISPPSLSYFPIALVPVQVANLDSSFMYVHLFKEKGALFEVGLKGLTTMASS